MKVVLIVGGIVLAVVVAGAAILVVALPDGTLAALRPQPARTEVRIENAAVRDLIETVSAPGEIEPLTRIEISAEVASRIEELPVQEGDEVRRGDVIVRLDDRILSAALQSAEAMRDGERFRLQSERARLEGLRKTLEFARRTLERQQALHDSGDVSGAVLDEAMERVEDLEASVESATHTISVIESSLAATEADIAQARDGLEKTVIRSPIEGVVTQLNAEVGEVVLVGTMNNPGTVILTIADLGRMILNARVAESDVAKVAEGQKARIHINAYPGEVFAGVVRRIALQRTVALDNTGHFETEVEIDLAGRRIYSGLVANVDIEIASHTGVVVQSQAVVERLVEDLPVDIKSHQLVDRGKKTTYVVYRVADGKAVCTPVRPGASDLTHRIVLGGLAEGDPVVVGPYKALEAIKHDELVSAEKPPAPPDGSAPAGQEALASEGAAAAPASP